MAVWRRKIVLRGIEVMVAVSCIATLWPRPLASQCPANRATAAGPHQRVAPSSGRGRCQGRAMAVRELGDGGGWGWVRYSQSPSSACMERGSDVSGGLCKRTCNEALACLVLR